MTSRRSWRVSVARAVTLCDADSGLLWLRTRATICAARPRSSRQAGLWMTCRRSSATSPATATQRLPEQCRTSRTLLFVDDIIPALRRATRCGTRRWSGGFRSVTTIALFQRRRMDRQPEPRSTGRSPVRPFHRNDPAGVRRPRSDRRRQRQAVQRPRRRPRTPDCDDRRPRGRRYPARLDIQPVLDRVVDHAQRLCEDTYAYVTVRHDTDMSRRSQMAGPSGLLDAGEVAVGAIPESRTTDDHSSTTVHGVRSPAEPDTHPRLGSRARRSRYPDSCGRASGDIDRCSSLPLRRQGGIVGVMTFVRRAGSRRVLATDEVVAPAGVHRIRPPIAVDNARLLREIGERNARTLGVTGAADGDVRHPAADQCPSGRPEHGAARHRRAGRGIV